MPDHADHTHRTGQSWLDAGSVEEEAHRLIEAAGEWWRTQQEGAQAHSAAPGPSHAESDHAESGQSGQFESTQGGTTGSDGHQGSASEPCTSCPWCRAKAAFGPIGSDTLVSLADLLAAAALSLRLYAESRRTDAPDQHETDRPVRDDE